MCERGDGLKNLALCTPSTAVQNCQIFDTASRIPRSQTFDRGRLPTDTLIRNRSTILAGSIAKQELIRRWDSDRTYHQSACDACQRNGSIVWNFWSYSIFSKRECTLPLLYAIAVPSVVCLSVCDVGAPYSGGWTFRHFFHHTIAQGLYFSGAKNRSWGTPLSPEICVQSDPPPFKQRNFDQYRLIAP